MGVCRPEHLDQMVLAGNKNQKGDSEQDEPPFEEMCQNDGLEKGGEA